jgi:murein DD-endopeptidase MepM/ murein hydrolase activator NlpD
VLVGLVGINVYVFFFNRGTAPREILNMQSTSKTFESRRQEALAADVRKAGELIASSNKPAKAASPVPVAKTPAPAPAAPVPASAEAEAPAAEAEVPAPHEAQVLVAREAQVPAPREGQVLVAARDPQVPSPREAGRGSGRGVAPPAPPAFKIPFAPPPEPVAMRAPAAPPTIKIPFAPPADDDADGGDAQAAQGIDKKFASNDTLGAVLAREGFGSGTSNVIAALAKLVDPRSIRGGQKYVVRMGDDGAPEAFEYQPTPALRYVVERQDDGDAEGTPQRWTARKLETTIQIKVAEAGGTVESSLYESVQRSGESTALVGLLVELFAWDVNFYIDTHPGDHWKVLIEKQYLGGQFYKYGRVLGAEYGGKVGTYRAFYWAGKDAPRDRPGKYYDAQGQALSKSMLKTPLRFVRISSKFDRKRFHPILHVERAHLGIDYAAPVGTPVWASASGRVVEAGPKHGSGNTIIIAHANGLATRYYHLSKFARGLHAGQQVKQKDVIGYVGTTGLSTGPHLHFSVTKNGAFVDPSKLAVNRDPPVAEPGAFLAAIRPRVAAMKAMQLGTPVAKN